MFDIITRKGWTIASNQTDEHPRYGTAYAVVKSYDPDRDGAREAAQNLEIAIRAPGGADNTQYLAYVLAENSGYTYPAGTPVRVFDIDPNVKGDQIDGKAGPSSLGWRLDGSLEVTANLRVYKDGKHRQAWVRIILRHGEDGVWRTV